MPNVICPDIEALVHRRASELVVERPRRRVVTVSGVGGIAVAAVCAVLFLVLGSPSGNGLMSPRQAVAAAVQSLGGDGILYWVRRSEIVDLGDPQRSRGSLVEESAVDLSNGDQHTVLRATSATGAQERPFQTWVASGDRWVGVGTGDRGTARLRRVPSRSAEVPLVPVAEELKAILERADQGKAEVAAAGEQGGVPLVVVTDRDDAVELRVWITREAVPQVVRVITTTQGPDVPRPSSSTTTTQVWRIVPRTPEALNDVEIPSTAKRVP